MSHYAVAVLTDGKRDVEELLAPYDENISVAPYIGRTKEKMIADAKSYVERAQERKDSGKELSEYAQAYLDAKDDEELYRLERDDKYCSYDMNGNELSTYNPNSKWDWYKIGGRWGGAFEEYGIDPSGTRVGDIKSLYDQGEYDKAARFWELYVEEQEPKDEEEKELIKFVFYKKEYYLDRYKDKDTYAKCRAQFGTFAIVTPDGVWHEPGRMGWWGMSGESDEDGLDWEMNFCDRYIKTANPDWTLTIVDCHI